MEVSIQKSYCCKTFDYTHIFFWDREREEGRWRTVGTITLVQKRSRRSNIVPSNSWSQKASTNLRSIWYDNQRLWDCNLVDFSIDVVGDTYKFSFFLSFNSTSFLSPLYTSSKLYSFLYLLFLSSTDLSPCLSFFSVVSFLAGPFFMYRMDVSVVFSLFKIEINGTLNVSGPRDSPQTIQKQMR